LRIPCVAGWFFVYVDLYVVLLAWWVSLPSKRMSDYVKFLGEISSLVAKLEKGLDDDDDFHVFIQNIDESLTGLCEISSTSNCDNIQEIIQKSIIPSRFRFASLPITCQTLNSRNYTDQKYPDL